VTATRGAPYDEPVPYVLTDAGQVIAGGYNTLTAQEAAALVRVHRSVIYDEAKYGELDGIRVDGHQWLFDRDTVLEYFAGRGARVSDGRPKPRVNAGPLLRQIQLRGGDAAVGVRQHSPEQKALGRAREDGTLTVWMADHLACQLLGMNPLELWGDEFLTA
jgi:excisionase family DNA binding protein